MKAKASVLRSAQLETAMSLLSFMQGTRLLIALIAAASTVLIARKERLFLMFAMNVMGKCMLICLSVCLTAQNITTIMDQLSNALDVEKTV